MPALASSLSSLIQQIGGAIGVASLAVLHELLKRRMIHAGSPELLAEQTAVRAGFAAAAVLTAIALFPALLMPKQVGRSSMDDAMIEVA